MHLHASVFADSLHNNSGEHEVRTLISSK